ncbi:MAG: DUF3683 domain-containing protein [Pseudomonadota bacterium]
MPHQKSREIPYNYTSADDARIIKFLLGTTAWYTLEKIRFQQNTKPLIKRFMRFMGDMFVIHRNPYVFRSLVEKISIRKTFLQGLNADLASIEQDASATTEIQTIAACCREYLKTLAAELILEHKKHQRIQKALGPIAGEDNISFDPFALISHATDATDWRLFLPIAIVWPDKEEQVPLLLSGIRDLGYHAIPRGAGTGLTGGAVPVRKNCIMINTEKLNRIIGMETECYKSEPGLPVLSLEAGVITGDAMKFAETKNYVFATDPTSAWACTIGGNIAENAGGKTAVLWGTAIDNIFSFRIAVSDGRLLEIRRVDRPLRKILPEDLVQFDILDVVAGNVLKTISLTGTEIRTKGLGKDITNKALNGLPGLQKEGTDGVITSAKFILHKAYECKSTCCIEFFGQDMDEAGRVIVDISKTFINHGEEALMALEHFDEEYVRAIQYKVKAPKNDSPKAVLLIDIVGHSPAQLEKGKRKLSELLKPYTNTFAFFTESRQESERFWQDRKKLGAIAKRTNAFKLNEDIVLPLSALPEFSNFVDRCNIEEERENQQSFAWQVSTYLEEAEPLADPEWLEAKIPAAKKLLREFLEKISLCGKTNLQQETHIRQLLKDLMTLFRGYAKVCREINTIYQETRSHLIVIATHMHAGDGNVHVNIPVFSNDREMMIRAMETADTVMDKALELDGVVSGEHGIGFTKLKYMDPVRIERLAQYRKEIDPEGVMNPGKLSDMEVPNQVFTPSFNLLGLEARILHHVSLGDLALKISNCIRCGKCKADCCVFYPQQNLFFHPRNKNLAIASLIEASLYEAQKFRSTQFSFIRHLEEIADHCTICHKCLKPCPVDIDTGEVSIMEKELLETRKMKHTKLITATTLHFLESRSPVLNAAFRNLAIRFGGGIQRNLAGTLSWLARKTDNSFPVPGLLSSPIPPACSRTLWSAMPPLEGNHTVLSIPAESSKGTVFYFPGCGSERLFGIIGKASIYILLKSNLSVILPPPFLCCGFPAKVNAKKEMESRITLRNIIFLTQIRETFGHVTFSACVVSCGTCREALLEQQADAIFQTKIMDVSAFSMQNGFPVPAGRRFVYHQPCHDSLNGDAENLLMTHGGNRLITTPGCCAEAGTMSLSRPDITAAMRNRKEKSILSIQENQDRETTILTNCPSCIQGLGRHSRYNIRARHLAVELALQAGGEKWEDELQELCRNAEVIHF